MKKTEPLVKDVKTTPKEKLPRRSDVLLDAIAQSAVKLLEAPDWRTEINDLLKLLGEATNASHHALDLLIVVSVK